MGLCNRNRSYTHLRLCSRTKCDLGPDPDVTQSRPSESAGNFGSTHVVRYAPKGDLWGLRTTICIFTRSQPCIYQCTLDTYRSFPHFYRSTLQSRGRSEEGRTHDFCRRLHMAYCPVRSLQVIQEIRAFPVALKILN